MSVAPLQFLLLVFAGWVNRHQREIIEYLQEENRVLREQLGGRRLRFTDAQRRRLAAKGKALGRRTLEQLAGLVTPDTILRWYRELIAKKYDGSARRGGGRTGTTSSLHRVVVQVATESPSWGAPRVHGELRMLGFDVSERTVTRLMPRRAQNPESAQRRMTFLRNHRDAIAAMDFFVVRTLTFRVLYVWFAIQHGRRRIVHFHVTDHPDAVWVAQQLREAFPFDTAPRHLVFDRDGTFSPQVVSTVKSIGATTTRTAPRSPWQNGVAERWIGSVRRELLDHVVVFNDRHLQRLLREYVAYYHDDRTHPASPRPRPRQARPVGGAEVIALPRLGGLHHRYEWRGSA